MKGRRLVTLLLLTMYVFLFLLPAVTLNLGTVNRVFTYSRVASATGANDSLSQCISGGEYLNYSVLTTGYSSPPPSGDFSLPPPEAQSVNLTFNDTFDGWFLIEVRRSGSTSFYAINNYSREVGDIGGCGGMSLSPPESPSDIVLETGCYSPFVFSNALAAGGRFRITLPFVDHESPHAYGEVVGTTTVSLWNGTDNEYYAVWKLSVNFANSTVVVGGAFYLEVNTGIMLMGFYSEGKVTSEEGYVFRNSQYRLRLEDSNVQKLRSQRLPVITGVFNLTEDYQSRDLDGCWLKYRTEGYLTLNLGWLGFPYSLLGVQTFRVLNGSYYNMSIHTSELPNARNLTTTILEKISIPSNLWRLTEPWDPVYYPVPYQALNETTIGDFTYRNDTSRSFYDNELVYTPLLLPFWAKEGDIFLVADVINFVLANHTKEPGMAVATVILPMRISGQERVGTFDCWKATVLKPTDLSGANLSTLSVDMYFDKCSGIMVKLVTHFVYNKPTEVQEGTEKVILPLETYHKELTLEECSLNGTLYEATPEALSEYRPMCTAILTSGESALFDSSWLTDTSLNLTSDAPSTVNVSTTTFSSYPDIASGKTAIRFIYITKNDTAANISGNLTIHYWPAELAGKAVLENLEIYAFNPENHSWTAIPSSTNTSTRTVTVEINHFSVFALVGENIPVTVPPELIFVSLLIYYNTFRDRGALTVLLLACITLTILIMADIYSKEKIQT